MKKALSVFVLALVSIFVLACNVTTEKEWKIVLITDVGTITDRSFNQGTWEGVKAFGDANDIETMYFRPNAGTQADYEDAIDMVVANGANVVVTPGFLFETAVYTKQAEYPDVYFILIDGVPQLGDYTTYEVADNTVSILFQEEQSGFLAGYAAVAEGYDNLGFMGGMAVPAVVRFGIGYVAGAYYAAHALSKTITFNAARYEYLGNFNNEVAHTITAQSWYDAGVDVIFAAAGGAGLAVMEAAELAEKVVIGVDVDQSGESDTVISSAMKQLAVAVQQELTALIIDNAFNGGETLIKGANQDAVGLPLGDSFKFNTFTLVQYQAILAQIKAGTIVVPTSGTELAAFLIASCGSPSASALVDKV